MRALWSDRENCSHNVSQKVKRMRRFSNKPLLSKSAVAEQFHCIFQDLEEDKRATTNVQNQFAFSFYYLFFSFVLLELKTLCFEGFSLGGKIMKKCQEVPKSVKNYETILPFSCCPLIFP